MVFYVQRETSDCEEVVGIGRIEGGGPEGDCLRGPDTPVEEQLFLRDSEVIGQEGGGEATSPSGFSVWGWGRNTYSLGVGDLSNSVEDSVLEYLVQFWLVGGVAEGDDK